MPGARSPMPPLVALALGLCACAGDPSVAMDLSGTQVEVTVLGDGFVRADGKRVPLEEFVLRMRQRLRALPEDERIALWVRVRVEQGSGPGARREVDRLLEELNLMGVRQVALQ